MTTDHAKPPGKKRRDCPAIETFISAADCGRQRGSQLACPAHCPHFPFGTAVPPGTWARLEVEWVTKAVAFLQAKCGREALQARLKAFEPPVKDRALRIEGAVVQLVMVQLALERDADGRTGVEAWEAAGFPGLNNDERVMTTYRRHTRATVVEVERLLDPRSFLARDLFDPDRPSFLVFSPEFSPGVARFARLLTYLTHYPHVSRLGVPTFEVPHYLWSEWERRVRAEHATAAATTPGLSLRDFVSRSCAHCVELLVDARQAYNERFLNQMDMHECLAAYRYHAAREEIEAVLREKPEFRAETPQAEGAFAQPLAAYQWLRLGESAALEAELRDAVHLDTKVEGVGTVGKLRFYPERLVVETLSKTKHAFARRQLERYLAGRIGFEEERVVDLTQVIADRRRQEATVGAAQQALFANGTPPESPPETASDAAAARLDPAQLEALRQEHERTCQTLLDTGVAILGGKTPREAASDPALRPSLGEWIKTQIHYLDRRNRERGTDLRLDAVLEVLGFPELK